MPGSITKYSLLEAANNIKPLLMGQDLYLYKVTTSQISSDYNRSYATVKRPIVHGYTAIPVTPDECKYCMFQSLRMSACCQVPVKLTCERVQQVEHCLQEVPK